MKNWIVFMAGIITGSIGVLVATKGTKTNQKKPSSSKENKLTDRELSPYTPLEELNEEISRLVWHRKYGRRSRNGRGYGAPAVYTGVDLIAWNDSDATINWGIRKENLMEELRCEIGGVLYTLKMGEFEQNSYLDALFKMCRDNEVKGLKFSLSRDKNKKFYSISFDSIKDLEMMKGLDFSNKWYDDVEVIGGK